MDAHKTVKVKRLTLHLLESVVMMKTGNTQDNT